MAANSKQPFRGKQRLDSKRLPKRPKPKARTDADGSPGSKRGKKRPGGLWGVVGLVGSFAALWLYSATQQSRQRRQKADADGLLLARLRSRPLSITEHGACRMGCRCSCRRRPTAAATARLRPPALDAPLSIVSPSVVYVDSAVQFWCLGWRVVLQKGRHRDARKCRSHCHGSCAFHYCVCLCVCR